MKFLLAIICFSFLSLNAAVQYNFKGNQGWLTFDSSTELTLDVSRFGNNTNHENFIDKGDGIFDFGWYNLDTNNSGSLKNNSFTFNENDKIALWLKDNNGNIYISSKVSDKDYIWGKSRISDEGFKLYGGNFGSNGSHEFYVFKINTVSNSNKTPSGQPLPGIVATLVLGFISLAYLKNRKELLTT